MKHSHNKYRQNDYVFALLVVGTYDFNAATKYEWIIRYIDIPSFIVLIKNKN